MNFALLFMLSLIGIAHWKWAIEGGQDAVRGMLITFCVVLCFLCLFVSSALFVALSSSPIDVVVAFTVHSFCVDEQFASSNYLYCSAAPSIVHALHTFTPLFVHSSGILLRILFLFRFSFLILSFFVKFCNAFVFLYPIGGDQRLECKAGG